MIRVRPNRDGNGGAIVSPNSIELAGHLTRLEARSLNATLQAGAEVKLIRQGDKSGLDQLTGQDTARRFGKVEAQCGDA